MAAAEPPSSSPPSSIPSFPSTTTTTTSATSPYPFAAAADIVRAHQKDAYFTGHLTTTLTELHRRLFGARATHALGPDLLRTVAALAYFSLTTLPGNRTLGEEYCDLVQVQVSNSNSNSNKKKNKSNVVGVGVGLGQQQQLPRLRTRAAYIVASILLPHVLGRVLPSLRRILSRLVAKRLQQIQKHKQKHKHKQKLHDEAAAATAQPQQQVPPYPRQTTTTTTTAATAVNSSCPPSSLEARLWTYLATHLSSPTSSGAAALQALTLAIFYFRGTYYELAKRLLSLRYVFTRAVPDTPDRAGYEVLGLLLVLQLAVQAYLHLRDTILSTSSFSSSDYSFSSSDFSSSDFSSSDSSSSDSDLLLPDFGRNTGKGAQHNSSRSRVDIALVTHTPSPTTTNTTATTTGGTGTGTGDHHRFSLDNVSVMRFIRGPQQRKCTLCLDQLKDPSATSCGHVFCWDCITDWVREKPECPLCRREALVQHVLPLRVF